MKTKRIILVSAMFLLTILVAGFAASTQDAKTPDNRIERRWNSKLTDNQTQGATVSTQNVAFDSPRAGRENIRSMQLIGDGAGWVLTKGHLFWTNSSGQEWLDITPRTPALISVDSVFFVDASAGWAVLSERDSNAESGHSLKLASTTDTGKSWSLATVNFPGEFPADYAGVVSVGFVDALHGWIMLRLSSSSNFSRGVLLMTSDGGNSWRRLPDPPIGSPARFVTATNGWLAGGPNGDKLYWTQDAGESWESRSVLPPAAVQKNSQRTYELPSFENQQDAILPVSFTGPQGLIKVFYRTHNGGKSWEPGTMSTSTNLDAYIASSVVNSKTVIVAQSNSAEIGILEEGRKGSTKRVAKIASADLPFTKIDFVTQDEGWLLVTQGKCRGFKSDCGQETKLFATADGGQVLTEITPGVGSSEKIKAENTTPLPDIFRENNDVVSPDRATISIQNQEGFDKCAVPTVAQMQVWWNSSPYKAANVYIGGENHSCKTQAISASWISSVMSMGWGLIPTWVGPQAPSVSGSCAANCTKMSTNSTTAEAQGVAEANKAADQAVAYGLSGSIIYYDMEAYDSNSSGTVVKAFMNGWVRRLKERGFDGGGYGSRLNVSDWANIANPPAAIWFTWFFQNGVSCGNTCHNVFGVPSISDSLWFNHQRIRQTSSGFNQCWSTTCLTIDEDWLDGPVAGGTSAPPPTSNTTDGFDYPIGKPNATGYAITGWDFLDWTGSVYHPAEDWNGSGGGDTDLGDPVYATANGTVVAAGNYGSGWGNIILIKHDLPNGGNVWSQYAHLQNILVSSGTVSRGQQIGTIGKGYNNEYSAHLHFEIRKTSLAADAWVTGLSQTQIQDRYYRPSTFVNANRPSSNTSPSPSISNVSPNPVTGMPLPGRVAITLNGANFVNKPTVFMTWTGGSATLNSTNVTFVSSSRLDLSVATDAVADDWTVRVTNPDGKVSNTATFSVVTQTPTISVSATSLSNFGSVGVGQNSAPQSYTISGSNLSANITIQAPTGFQVSLSSTSGYTNTLTLTQSGGSVPTTTIYARFSPQSSGTQTGNISHISSGVTTRNVSVSGSGTDGGVGMVQFSSATYSVNENGGSRTITVTRTGGTGAFVVNYGTSNGTATAGVDYTGLAEVLSFATNETSKTFNVPIINDTLVEGNETVNLTLSNPSGGATLGSPITAVLTIVDDDSTCTYSISESEHTVSPGSTSVNFFMDAPSGCAWTAVSDSPSWLTTSSSGSGDGTISYQTAVNPSSNPRVGHITIGGQVHTVTQIGVGGAGNVRFSSVTYTSNEGGGVATITVTRTGGTGTGTVQYSTSDGTAMAGTDYVSASGTLLFVGDETSKSFNVTILDDTTFEGNESFSLSLNNNSSSFTLGNPSTATLTIIDNDISPDSTGPGLSINSHNTGQTVSSSTITLSGTASDSGRGDSGISSVIVNGIRANSDTSSGAGTANWSQSITLSPGLNNITVQAKDGSPGQNSTTLSISVTFSPSSPAELTTPANGSTLSSGPVAFTWSMGSGVSQYQLWVGSSPRIPGNNSIGHDIYDGAVTTATSANVSGIPEDGRIIYATLWSMINGLWQPKDYSYRASICPPAEMLSPAVGTVLSNPATFNWGTSSCANAYQLWLGTSPSTYNLYIGPVTTMTTETVSPIQTVEQTIYVTLWTRIGKEWYSRAYTYKAPPKPAEIIAPVPGSRFNSTTAIFNWNTSNPAADAYQLWIGNQPRVNGSNLIGHDIYIGPVTTANSATVKGLPSDGRKVYVTLWTKINTDWYPKDYSYDTVTCTGAAAVELTSPANNSTFTSSSATFKWNENDCITSYQLWVGSTPRDTGNSPSSHDIYYGDVGGVSATLNTLPEDGRALYVTLWSFINGQWYPKDYTFTANIKIPEVTSPQHLTTFNSSQVTFNWTSVSAATDYYLYVGNGLRTYDIYNQYVFNGSTTVPNIPMDGRIIYVTIWGKINGKWYGSDYRYIACSSCGGAGTVARITDPLWGSIFSSNSHTFSWDAGVNATQYWLFVGSTPGAYDLHNADLGMARARTVNNLPTDGRTLYVTLFSMINGEWHQNQYAYTAMRVEKAKMISPIDGATLPSSTVTFSWDAGKGVTGYWLFVGSTPGAYDLYNAEVGTALSRTVTGLPTDGRTVYVTLFSKINGEWQSNTYTYTASR